MVGGSILALFISSLLPIKQRFSCPCYVSHLHIKTGLVEMSTQHIHSRPDLDLDLDFDPAALPYGKRGMA